jgi:hypothetical protein
VVTEDLNRRWYEANTGQVITDIQRRIRHPILRWMAATLDGRIQDSEAVFEAKFMLPWSFSEEGAAAKYMPQLQHNMWVVAARSAVLSVITGGSKWVEIKVHADPLFQHLIVTAERKFWRCVESGELPSLFGNNSAESAAIWARRILPAKNSLEAADARQLGEAFQARLAEFEDNVDETRAISSQTISTLDATSSVGPQTSNSTRPSSAEKIDKSLLVHQAPRRVRDKDHVRFVARQACLICGRTPSDAHHLRFAQTRALSRRASDEFTVPLCRCHHRELHRHGDEPAWWEKTGIDPMLKARALWLQSHPLRTDATPSAGTAANYAGPKST